MSDVITLVTAPAGSGKSYTRARYLVDQFLPETNGDYWSNLPIDRERIAAFCAERDKCEAEEILQRLHYIEPEVIERWRDGSSGPWEYFKEVDLQDAVVVLDEAHEFISRKHARPIKKEWQRFLGQIRHRGCRIEFISQHEDKLATEVVREAVVRIELASGETSRDPFFKIRMGDWYELLAGWFTGEVRACFWEVEFRQVVGTWKESERRRYHFDPTYFQFYDSFSLPETGGVKAEAPAREFEQRTRMGLLGWFVRRNWWRLGRSAAIAAALLSMPWTVPLAIREGMGLVKAKVSGGAGGTERSEVSTVPSAPALPSPAVSEAALAELEKLRADKADLESQLAKRSELVAITDREAVLLAGGRLRVGDSISMGFYRGRKIESIDWERRAVRLDDGTLLRVGAGDVMPEWQAGADGYAAAGSVQGFVPLDGSRDFEKRERAERRENGNVELQRNEHAGVQPSAGGPVPGQHRMGRKLR